MNEMQSDMLDIIAGIRTFPTGAYNIRVNGASAGRESTKGVNIVPKEGGAGLDIFVAPGVKETVYIPVVISETDLVETVYNDIHIGEEADVKIVAGCGIHNTGDCPSQHDGVHSFHLGRGAKVQYLENHYGEGSGERILNPVTNAFLAEDSYLEIETIQIEGVDSTKRLTYVDLGDRATVIVREKLMTDGEQFAETTFNVDLNGEDCSANVTSRSVAKGHSNQAFLSKINGNNRCMGHSECDSIIMDSGCVKAVPEITANHVEASLIHEAAIGKIAGEQIVKLLTLGLTEEEAEQEIVNGFLK